MPTVMFWNVQGSGGDTINSTAGDLLLGDLSDLTADEKPDLIVLCELKLGFQDTFDFTALGGEYAKVDIPKTGYPAKTTYRFGAIIRSAGRCVVNKSAPPALIDGGASRPALSIVVNRNVGLLAVHAPSVSASITPQMQHVQTAVGNCSGARVPKIIFGDFNMDLLGDRQRITNAMADGGLGKYRLRPLPQHTESTHVMGKALDWAMVDPDYSVSYRLADAEKSDHWPICITWR